jgi:hypothetical protein
MRDLMQSLGLVLLSLLLLVGCGKKDIPEKPAPKPVVKLTDQVLKSAEGAAKLVELTEVEAIYGFAFEEVVAGPQTEQYAEAGLSTCIFKGKGEHGTQAVSVALQPIINGANAEESFKKTAEELGGFAFGANVQLELVEGIPEKAGWVEMMGTLYVFKGKYYALINATSPAGRTSKEISIALAKKVANRIP